MSYVGRHENMDPDSGEDDSSDEDTLIVEASSVPNFTTIFASSANSSSSERPARKATSCSHCNAVGHTKRTCTVLDPSRIDANKRKRTSSREKGRKTKKDTEVDEINEEHGGNNSCEDEGDEKSVVVRQRDVKLAEEEDDDEDAQAWNAAAETNEPVVVDVDDEPPPPAIDLRSRSIPITLDGYIPRFLGIDCGPRVDTSTVKTPFEFFRLFWSPVVMTTL